jgi:insulysin
MTLLLPLLNRRFAAEMMIRSSRLPLVAALCCFVSANSWAIGHIGAKAPTQGSLLARKTALVSLLETTQSEVVHADLLPRNDSGETIILADADSFKKPERDMRDYRVILLPNNLQVLLVSDNLKPGDVGIEAASVHVHAGHMDDTLKGLAHFNEHMLFLGTAKYPSEEEYENFLSKYGGFSNAYTDMEDTNYYFSVTTEVDDTKETSEALAGALDRFAQFFIAPTFDRDAVDRELRAIDSEYTMSKTSDSWRNFQLLKSSCDQQHPFMKFGCGNYATLTESGLDVLLGELERFWKTYYQTYNIRLAVVGHGSLDALQATVEQTFGQLEASFGRHRRAKSLPGQVFPRENAVYGTPAFGPKQLGLIRKVIPYAETRVIKIYFAAPPMDDLTLLESKPYRVISHILGHESPGSLHVLLNEEGYLSGITSGVAIDTSDFSLFSLTLSVTPKGMEEREKVLDLAFQWISLLKENTHRLADYHDELRLISDMNFRFRENGDPTDFVSTAAELLFEENTKPSNLLFESSASSEFEPVVAKAFLDRISPENCMITITSSDFNSTEGEWQVEPWYGAPSQTETMSEEQLARWTNRPALNSRLQIPALNKYIPTDFSLRCDDPEHMDAEVTEDEAEVPPTLVIDQPNLRLWHKMDRFWRVPKAFVRVAILSSRIYSCPRSITLNRLFQRVLNDDLNSFAYDASVAGCNYRVSCTPSGYRISVSGYSEKMPFLLDTITSRIKSLITEMKGDSPVLKAMFEKAKEGLLRETKNYRLDSPSEVNSYNSRLLIEEQVWYLDNYVDELEGELAARDPLTMAECAMLTEECFMGRVKCEALCMGNIDQGRVTDIAEVLQGKFLGSAHCLSEVETPRFRSFKLPTRKEAGNIFGREVEERKIPLVYSELAYTETEENNAVELIFQAGSELDLGYEGIAILDLFSHIAYNSAFNQLRTKEQLGYIVSTFARKTAGSTWGLSVVVQSNVALPEKLEERCEAWLEQFRRELEEISPASIATEASAVVAQLKENETKLSQEVSRVWGEILNTEGLTDRLRTPAFDRLDRLAAVLTVDDDEEELEEGSLEENEMAETDSSSMTGVELKRRLLELFDDRFSAASPRRRAMSARVYSHNCKAEYEASLRQPGVVSSFAEMRQLKQFLSSWPTAPYWRIEKKPV